VHGTGTAGRVAAREEYIRSAYADADEKLGIARSLMGGNPTTFAGSDHGFAPAYYAVNANAVLNQASVTSNPPSPAAPATFSLRASSGIAQNCNNRNPIPPNVSIATDIAKACWAGGTIQIYINPARLRGSSATADPSWPSYAEVRAAIKAAFEAVTDPAHPGAQVILKIMNKEELRNVDGSDSLHPNRSGDVVVVTAPPYQSDAGTDGVVVSLSHFFGQHGYLPNTVDLANNINMHATFVMAGPSIKHLSGVEGLRAVDVAPTLSFLMGIRGSPERPRRHPLRPDHRRRQTGRGHAAQRQRLARADPTAFGRVRQRSGVTNLTFAIGGSAFLKPWFDTYTAEAQRTQRIRCQRDHADGGRLGWRHAADFECLRRHAGDRVHEHDGRRPRRPRNHNFDRGSAYLRKYVDPARRLPVHLIEVVDSNGKTPAEWSKSWQDSRRRRDRGIGFVGFTNDDARPSSSRAASTRSSCRCPIRPTQSMPRPRRSRSRSTASLRSATSARPGGSLTAPTGPLPDLADDVSKVSNSSIGDPHRPAGPDRPARTRVLSRRTAARASASRGSGSSLAPQTPASFTGLRTSTSPEHRRHSGCRHPGRDQRAERRTLADPRHTGWRFERSWSRA
jgi:hypothetical protein